MHQQPSVRITRSAAPRYQIPNIGGIRKLPREMDEEAGVVGGSAHDLLA